MVPGLLFAALRGFVSSDGVPTGFGPVHWVALMSIFTLLLRRLGEFRALANCNRFLKPKTGTPP